MSDVEHSQCGEFPVLFVKVNPVTDNEGVGYNKTGIGYIYGIFSGIRLVE
jgi:hypothetical protein